MQILAVVFSTKLKPCGYVEKTKSALSRLSLTLRNDRPCDTAPPARNSHYLLYAEIFIDAQWELAAVNIGWDIALDYEPTRHTKPQRWFSIKALKWFKATNECIARKHEKSHLDVDFNKHAGTH